MIRGRRPMARRPSRRARDLWIALAALPVIAGAVLLGRLALRKDPDPTAVILPALAAVTEAVPITTREMRPMKIARGATLAGILAGEGFDAAETAKLREAVKPVYDLARLRSGQEMRFFSYTEGGWAGLEYDVDGDRYLAVSPEGDGYAAVLRPVPYTAETAVVWGAVEDTTIGAVARAGEEQALALEMAEILGWDIDFYTDVQRGDSFRLLFEKKFLRGEFRGYGAILAVEFVNQGKAVRAFRFTDPASGKASYYDDASQSMRKAFLKSPLPFGARVTSRFSLRRLHPIRRVYRAHYGVDYSAPIGHPVRATAPGTVLSAGRNGAAGLMVHLRHANAYETMYLHLSRVGAGVRKGARVEGGQVIGYVGSSGESTGPHLDYRIKNHGRYINPLSAKFEPAEPLRAELRPEFERVAAIYRAALDAPLALLRAAAGIAIF